MKAFTEEEAIESVEHLLFTVAYELLIQPGDDEPDLEVKVTAVNSRQLHALIKVSKDDIGKVIGRDGVIISAIRTILFAVSRKIGREVKITIR